VFGFNHADVGALLTRSWGMPETFHLPIQHHHRLESLPETCSGDTRARTAILHLSALYIELVNSGNMTEALGRITHFINAYGFQNSLDAVQIGKELIRQTKDISPIFDIQFRDEGELEGLLEKAKQEVLNISMDLISDLIKKNSELELLRLQANKDALTQLDNYKAFCETLHQEISRAGRYKHPLCLVLADIDFFKSVNDGFGHLAGDQALRVVAQNLRTELRGSDFIARYGGEEFAIILPDTNLVDALQVVERLRKKIRALEISYNNQPIRVTLSFGVAAFRQPPPMSFNDLVKSADDALYSAKNQGRDRCCVAS
jgi:diguanylate cyclase